MDNLNNLDKIFNQNNKNVVGFIKGYSNYLVELINCLDAESIAIVIAQLEKARENENTIFIIGNGGSAATASHIGNDFGLVALKIPSNERIKPFRAMSLTDNNSVITAIGNDDGYENIFIEQLKMHFRPGDKLIAISASGNSPNVVKAAHWFKNMGGEVIGWVGFDGGKLKEIANNCILIKTPKGEYGPIEDLHMILDHIIVTWLKYSLMSD